MTDDSALRKLTAREQMVLQLLADGVERIEVAARLGITVRTVDAHTTNARIKLNAENMCQAVALAVKRGIVSPN